MIVVQLRRALHEPEIAAPEDGDRRIAEGLISLDAAVGAEEPQFVADDRTAQRHIRLEVLAAVGRNALHVGAVETLRNDEERRRPVELVAAALGDNVHELPDHTRAVRGFRPEGLDLDILNRVVIQVDGEDVAAVWVGDVGAVKARPPLGPGELLRRRIDRHSRHDQPRVLKAAVGGDRHRRERLVVDVDRQPGPLRIDNRRLADNRDRLGHRSDAERELEIDYGVQADDRFLDDGLKSGELSARVVRGGRQVADAERARRVTDGGELSQRFRALQRNRHAGQHGTARVDHFSCGGSRCRALRHCDRRDEQEYESECNPLADTHTSSLYSAS